MGPEALLSSLKDSCPQLDGGKRNASEALHLRPPSHPNNLGKNRMSLEQGLEAASPCVQNTHKGPGLPVHSQELEIPAVLAGGGA